MLHKNRKDNIIRINNMPYVPPPKNYIEKDVQIVSKPRGHHARGVNITKHDVICWPRVWK